MAQTLLEQLHRMTKVVADTGDFESILRFHPQDSTTNPSLITAAANMPVYRSLVDDVLTQAKEELGTASTDKEVASLAFKRLAVTFGKRILAIIPGRVSTEVDARLSYDQEGTVNQAGEIIHTSRNIAGNHALLAPRLCCFYGFFLALSLGLGRDPVAS